MGLDILGSLGLPGIKDFVGMEFNSDEATAARDHSAQQAQINRDFQERMSNTSWQRGVADMQAAGINPMLGVMKGQGASTPGGMGTSSPSGSYALQGTGLSPTTAAQVDNLNAQTEREKASAREIDERTKTYPVSIDAMKAQIQSTYTNISKMLEEIKNIGQATSTSAASESNIRQQTENLKATVPQIEAMVRQLKAQTQLTYADAKLRGMQSGLTEAQWNETQQRISANLPAAEAALLKVQEALRQLERPQAGMRAATYNTPVGALGEMMRALNPFLQHMPSTSTTTISHGR